MYDLLKRLNQEEKITIIMVSHDIRAAVLYADHILHISEEPLFFGTKEEYQNSEIGKEYLSVTGGEQHV